MINLRSYLILCVFCLPLIFSCFSGVSNQGSIKNTPAKQFENYIFDSETELLDRLNNSGDLVLDYLKKMDGDETYTFYELSDSEQSLLNKYLELLPENFKEILNSRLIGIYFVNDFLGSGLADYVVSEQGELYYLLVFNQSILNKSLSELVSYKENTCFRIDNSELSMDISLSDEYAGLLYILLHEVTHIYDYANRITPYTEPHLKELIGEKEDSSPFTDKFWSDYYKMNDSLKISYKDKIHFYGENDESKISNNEMINLYRELETTPFASVYSYLSWAEDFAEYVTYYHLTQNLNMKYAIRILEGDHLLFEYEPFSNQIVLDRVRDLAFLNR